MTEIIDFLDVEKNEINNLPENASISTMCASLKLNVTLSYENISKYLELNSEDILKIQYKDELKTLLKLKTKKKHNNTIVKSRKNVFYNQITIVVRIDSGPYKDINKLKQINMKLFGNGSIQMSGCKSLKNINIALNKLVNRLSEVIKITENDTIVEKRFIEGDKIRISNFKIDMINSNYKLNMIINRENLYELLTKKKIKSYYEPCIRACVIIKYIPDVDNNDLKEISVFIFEKGNIIITGARSKNHIVSSYNYVNNILKEHQEENNIDIDTQIKREEELIFKFYKEIEEQDKLGMFKNKIIWDNK
jgi:TATA-box binding protein (TBP) (component of TFIID and TFIIIB)